MASKKQETDWIRQPQLAWSPYQASDTPKFGIREAAHLFRRAGFGGTVDQILTAVDDGLEVTLERLFGNLDDEKLDQELETSARLVSGTADAKQLAAWWMLRMTQTSAPFLEKMTLFWHGHFATGAEKVQNARAMFRQNQLLRKHAFGKFEPMVKEISSDVAMLVYLDSEENVRTRPNENYARELMELFCLGPGNYTERDIKEIARCFTGWTIRNQKFRFNDHQHDKKAKSFLGATGNFDGNDAVEVVLQQPAASRFIAKKLIRFFVVDEVDLTDEFVQPVATKLAESNFDIKSTMKLILSSNFFFSDSAVGQKIKSPVELAVGFLRFFQARTNMNLLSERIAGLGQLPFYPPNVKGWNGGATWINASSVLGRANLIAEVLRNDKTKFAAGSLDQWLNRQRSADRSLMNLLSCLMPVLPSKSNLQTLQELSSAGSNDQAIRLVSAVATLPEFQLN